MPEDLSTWKIQIGHSAPITVRGRLVENLDQHSDRLTIRDDAGPVFIAPLATVTYARRIDASEVNPPDDGPAVLIIHPHRNIAADYARTHGIRNWRHVAGAGQLRGLRGPYIRLIAAGSSAQDEDRLTDALQGGEAFGFLWPYQETGQVPACSGGPITNVTITPPADPGLTAGAVAAAARTSQRRRI